MKYLMSKYERREEGFTMIEIMVTVAIISIISVAFAISFQNQKKSGVDDSVKADLSTAALNIKEWKVNNPNGAISNALVADIHSQKDTRISMTTNPDGTFILTGINPRGNDASTGITYDSKKSF